MSTATQSRRRSVASRTARLLPFGLVVTCLGPLAGVAQAAPAPQPAWKPFAVVGPTNIPPRQSEVQRITAEAEGGTFTLEEITRGEGKLAFATGFASVAAGSKQATVVFASEGAFAVGMAVSGTGIPAGTTVIAVNSSVLELSAEATVTSGFASLAGSSEEVTEVTAAEGGFHAGDSISGTGIPAGTTIESATSDTLILSQFPTKGGTSAITAAEVSGDIPYDASEDELQASLEAMPAFAGHAVDVTAGPGGEAERSWSVAFQDDYALKNVDPLVADDGLLVGAHATVSVFTVVPGGNGTGEIKVFPVNVGGRPTSGTLTVEVGPLPPGVVLAAGGEGHNIPLVGWNCTGAPGADTAVCTLSTPVPGTGQQASPSGAPASVMVPIEVESAIATNTSTEVTVSGAEGGSATIDLPIVISAADAPFGIQSFWAGAFEADGTPSTQAGGHPASAVTDFALNTIRTPGGSVRPAEDPKDENVDLPAGFIGDPLVTERCPQFIAAPLEAIGVCGDQDVVGVLGPMLAQFGEGIIANEKLYNDVPAKGTAAEFSTIVVTPIQSLVGSVRSSEDFGVRVSALSNATFEPIFGAYAALQGTPAAANGLAFLTNPTDCSVQREESAQGRGPTTVIQASSWQKPNEYSRAEDPLPLLTGCKALTDAWRGHGAEPEKEEPSFSFHPSTDQGSSPTGATAVLHVPQEGLTDPDKLATAHLKKAVVTLPQGLDVNPSSANGLEACSEAQIGYVGSGFLSPNHVRFNEAPVSCPDASKLGTVQVKTPLLEEELEGTIYLAAQEENPFDSLIGLYLVVESERFGLTLKLPGEVKPDLKTGQLTATFDDNPQVPFEDLTLNFRGGGPRSTLATPETCGHFETTGSLEPWSAESGEALQIHEAGFSTSGSCASSDGTRPFSPTFEAGTTGTQAGAYSPLAIKIARKDGEQELTRLNFTLPKGLTGKLAGIPYCSDVAIQEAASKRGKAEQASPSCPAASRLGSVDTSAGVGSEPIHVGGSVYLAGPYEGAPLSSVVITPAVAGPFDLGTVVVRAPLFVDPETTQITAKSDPIPTILKGINLKLRSVTINLDRSTFTLNPTSCEPMTLTSSMSGSSGATTNPSNRFQVGGCGNLAFKPKLKIQLEGATKRAGNPGLKAVVTYPQGGGYANIARAQVNLPHGEFLDQGNLNKTCTKPVLLAGNCPANSIYGKAKAWTPLLDKPLEGPVYLVGGYGYKLPALVAELNGQIRVLLVGKVDSGPNRGIRNTFEVVPDAPVSRFVLEMKGGKKYGLLENSENLCKASKDERKATVQFTGQNGKVQKSKPVVANQCGKKKGGKKKSGRGKKSKK
jgi:hypothetical protein